MVLLSHLFVGVCRHTQTLKDSCERRDITEEDALLRSSPCNDIMSLLVQSEAISQL